MGRMRDERVGEGAAIRTSVKLPTFRKSTRKTAERRGGPIRLMHMERAFAFRPRRLTDMFLMVLMERVNGRLAFMFRSKVRKFDDEEICPDLFE